MSLYNMLMGRNRFSPYLLACLNITEETAEQYPVGRIRDVWCNAAADRISILTRNYGEEWEHVDAALAAHPNFVRKYSEDDSTYSSYEFTVPEENLDAVRKIAEMSDTTPPFERYKKLIDDMGSGKKNAQVEHAMEVGKKIFEPLIKSLENEGPTSEVVENEFGSVQIFSSGKPKAE